MTSKIYMDFCFQPFDVKFLESLSKNFSKYDSDGDGRLTKQEFSNWLVDGGTKKSIAKKLYYIADHNNDGSLSLLEFSKFAEAQEKMMINDETENYIKLVYDSVRARSSHPDGLDQKEFLEFMNLINSPVAALKKNKIFKQYDSNSNGTVDFKEIMDKINFRYSQLFKADN